MSTNNNTHQTIIDRTVGKLHNAILLSGATASRDKVEEYVRLGFPRYHEIAHLLHRESRLSAVANKLSEACQKITKFLNTSLNKTHLMCQQFFTLEK